MRNLFFVLSLCLFSCTNSNNGNKAGEMCSSINTVDGELSINNNYFMSLENGMILSVHSIQNVSSENAKSNFKVAPVYPRIDSSKWQIAFVGDEFEVFKNTLIVSEIVKNDDSHFTIFDLTEGNKIIEYTYDKFEVLFSDENEKRFLGFYSQNGAQTDNEEFSFKDNSFGFLSYANQHGGISKIRIDAADVMWLEIFDVANPVIEMLPIQGNAIELNGGKTLYFTSSDGKQSNDVNFDIQFTYYTKDTYQPTSFLLEVRSDKIIVPDDFSNTVFNLESL